MNKDNNNDDQVKPTTSTQGNAHKEKAEDIFIPSAVIDFGDRGKTSLKAGTDATTDLRQQKLLEIETKQKLFIDNEIKNLPEGWQVHFDEHGHPYALINPWGEERLIPTAEEILVEHEGSLSAANMHIIESYVRHRYAQLGLSLSQFTKKLGFRDYKKAQKKLNYLFEANWSFTEEVIQRLPAALEVPSETIAYFVEQTKTDIHNRFEIKRRETFEPFAALITKNSRPSSITMAGFAGATRNIDISSVEQSRYVEHILQHISTHQQQLRVVNGFFGGILGIAVNYTPDITVKLDLEGNFIGTMEGNFHPSHVVVHIL